MILLNIGRIKRRSQVGGNLAVTQAELQDLKRRISYRNILHKVVTSLKRRNLLEEAERIK
jgi:hypothetical protein